MLPSFTATPFSLAASAVVLVLTLGISFTACQRSHWRRSVLWLEGLRIVLVALCVITLNQPEIERRVVPKEKPTLVVLHDGSGSMQTQDVLGLQQATPTTRQQAVQGLLAPQHWKPLATKMDVVFEAFSASDDGGTDINRALQQTLTEHANLQGIVLVSDGDWNTGESPINAATQLRMQNIPVFAIATGSETHLPDVELVSLDAPTFGVAGKSMRIPFSIVSTLPRDVVTTVELNIEGSKPIVRRVRIPAKGRLDDAIVWRPHRLGETRLTLTVPLNDSEVLTTNNRLTAPISIREEKLSVLLVESFPRWEYRYLRNALERDPGVDVRCLLFHPRSDNIGGGPGYLDHFPPFAELQEYDVVFVGDVGVANGELSAEQCRDLRQLVRNHASGLVFMPGFRGKQHTLLNTELSALYPVVLDDLQPKGWGSRNPGQFELTEAGRRSLLTRLEEESEENTRVWSELPGFQWHAASLRAKIGSEVLVVHKSHATRSGRTPLIVTRTFGTGKILFMGTDAAWRWREGVEDKYHYRFWGQVARWMAYQRRMSQSESLRLFYSPDRPRTGDTVTLNANASTDSGEPLQEGTVSVQIVAPSGVTKSVNLRPGDADSWGLFTGSWTPEEGGEYTLTTNCDQNGEQLTTTLDVRAVQVEKTGQPIRMDTLSEIARVSRGRAVKLSELGGLLEEIASRPETDPIVIRHQVWSNPFWGLTILVLMGCFWVGRKLAGSV